MVTAAGLQKHKKTLTDNKTCFLGRQLYTKERKKYSGGAAE